MNIRIHINSVFFKMLFLLSIPICFGFLFYSIINYRNSLEKIEANRNWQRDFILKQIRDNLGLYDFGMVSYEQSYNDNLKRLSQKIIDQFHENSSQLTHIDLHKLLRLNDPDSLVQDLYIIDRNYTIVNTTFSKDSGLNFAKRDLDLKIFFDSVFSVNNCIVDRFTVERSTQKTKKYCYQSTTDQRYILEMGLTSESSTQYKQLLDSVVFSLKNQFRDIMSIHLLQASYNSSEPGLLLKFKSVYNKCIQTKSNQHIEYTENGMTKHADFLYLPIQSSKMFDAYIIQVISDDSVKNELINDELNMSFYFFCLTFFPVFIVLIFIARSLARPIKLLSIKTKKIDETNWNESIEVKGTMEINELSANFSSMLHRLKESYDTLEDKVKERTSEIHFQKKIIEEKHLEITDSINYAQRIQHALLANEALLQTYLSDYFIFYQPKEAVSGDFYWASVLANSHFCLVCADSTGHGVPGAIMSIVNINNLRNSVKEGIFEPSEILDHTRKGVIEDLSNDGSDEGGKDGMDCVILSFDFENQRMKFAMANNPVWIIRNHELIKFTPDKMPVGRHINQDQCFTQFEFDLMQGDLIYLFSDGYPDQFGGPKEKKFKLKALEQLLLELSHNNMEAQKNILQEVFNQWKGENEQTDDVCVIGIKIP